MAGRRGGSRRPTIADIAARAGVSSGAVSYALNGRPGVSDDTRARILEVAREAGWVPSAAARALTGVGSATVGLVITREPAVLGIEPFFMAFVAGIEEVLSERGYALLLQVTPRPDQEVQTYRAWWSAGRVDGIFLTDLRSQDRRLPLLGEIGLPAVAVGDPSAAGDLPAVWSDDAHAAVEAVERLAALGHRRMAHVTGPAELVHTQVRSAAMREACAERGLEPLVEVRTDYTLDSGAGATRALLEASRRPTAIVFDNDLTALAGVRVAEELGLRVPGDVSVIAWDDSPLCRLTNPPLSALSRDVSAYGAAAARVLLDLVRDGVAASDRSSVPALVDRGSIAPPPI
ncbi:LacI family DNA-binding transcriptional regulator [Actinotalea sp. BY-33]|uniref:LacI family DNA-binding transcriptional regulator n=1 Tax=Actinotalea soli TaxID=2819234 RepID=A0A939LR83_9CELL|nr:LacI family DNA-binding transcriptional regulator [Actinotalea soli]MBO1752594.1 LacI family DNA-binding transcriptional regulator [Actinotalea soli]